MSCILQIPKVPKLLPAVQVYTCTIIHLCVYVLLLVFYTVLYTHVVQASLAANTFAITGTPEDKRKFYFINTCSVFIYSCLLLQRSQSFFQEYLTS